MGGERAHPELLGQLEGVAVAVFGRLGLERVATRGDLGEERESPR